VVEYVVVVVGVCVDEKIVGWEIFGL